VLSIGADNECKVRGESARGQRAAQERKREGEGDMLDAKALLRDKEEYRASLDPPTPSNRRFEGNPAQTERYLAPLPSSPSISRQVFKNFPKLSSSEISLGMDHPIR